MNPQSNLARDIDLIFEMGNIRLIDRMWRRFQTPGFANLADHHFRVFWIAMIIAEREKGADTGKVAKMALLHDITESRTGDVDYLSRQYVERNEELAIQDMLDGTSIKEEFYQLWQEYEDRTSLEAKIVKDADNLDVDFELMEQAVKGNGLSEVKRPTREFVGKNKLYTDTAKQMFAELQNADPHAWHVQARNRSNGGDWQNDNKLKKKK